MWIFFNFHAIQLLFAMCFMKTLMKVTSKHLGLIINKRCWSFDLFRFSPPSPCTLEVGKVAPETRTLSSSHLSVFHLYLMVFFICLYYWYIWNHISRKRCNRASDWWLETSASLDSLPMPYLYTRQKSSTFERQKEKTDLSCDNK